MADVAEVTAVVEKKEYLARPPKPKLQKPGDNPNKLKAMGRQNYRPRAKDVVDTSVDEHATKVPFADPLPAPAPPTRGKLTVTDEEEFSGDVDIRLMAGIEISDLFAQHTVEYADQTNLPQLSEAAVAIPANTYFGIARSIYKAATPTVKTALTRYKGVYYYDSKLPDALSPLVSIFGDFNSKLGKIGVRYPEQRFMQLTTIGVRITEEIPPAYNYGDIRAIVDEESKTIWNIPGWEDFARGIGHPAYTQIMDTDYDFAVGEPQIATRVRPPRRQPLQTAAAYEAEINALFAPELAYNITRLEMLRTGAEVTFEWFADPAQAAFRDLIGVRVAPPEATGHRLVDRFTNVERIIISRYLPRLQKVWRLTESTATGSGYPAMTITGPATPERLDRNAYARIPMSDADYIFGFMMLPCTEFRLRPSLQVDSIETRLAPLTEFMDRSRAAR